MKQPAARTYNVHEAKTNLSKLLERTADGEEIIIARAGVPVARLVPIIAPVTERPLGSEQGAVLIADDFDAPLSPDLLDAFER
jgi:prevent-host-death family protein